MTPPLGVLDDLPMALWLSIPDGEECAFVNAAWGLLHGLAPGDAAGRGWMGPIHPEDRPGVERAFEAITPQSDGFDVGYRCVGAAGGERILRLSVRRRSTPGALAARWIGHVTAAPEGPAPSLAAPPRASAEQRHDDVEEKFRGALRLARLRFWEASLTRGVSWSRGLPVPGVPADPPRWTAVDAFLSRIHPEDRDRVLATCRAAEEPLGPPEYTLRYRVERSGAERWIEARGTVDRAAGGGPLHYGVAFDITEWYRSSERLREDDRLNAIGTFAAGMAHELNNQLAVILGFAQMALRRSGATAATRPLENVITASRRSAAIVRSVLAFARRQPLWPTVVDIGDLVERVEPALREAAGECPLYLVRDGTGLSVHVDPTQFEVVLGALVRNARAASEPGQPITILTNPWPLPAGARPPAPPTHLELRVIDSGRGMTPEVKARVFEPFFTTSSLGQSLGLGLAAVRGIVTQSGGTIELESLPGEGTAVRLLFPLVEARRERVRPRRPVVLVVDDEPAVLELIGQTLTEAGMRPSCTASVEAAMEAIVSERPDLLVLDLGMCGTGGRDLYADLCAVRGPVPALYVSGSLGDPDPGGSPGPGARIVRKPFTLEELLHAVEHALTG